MKWTTITMVACLVGGCQRQPPLQVRGDWIATLNEGAGGLRLALNISERADGGFDSRLYSLDQGGREIPGRGAGDGRRLRLEFGSIGAVFEGDVNASSDSIVGLWQQGGGSDQLTFHRRARSESPAPEPATPSDLDGDWEGELPTRSKTLHVLLRIANASTGLTARVISLDQGRAEIPVTIIERDGDAIHLTLDGIGATFAGRLDGARHRIAGQWTQSGTVDVTFVRVQERLRR